MCRQLWQPKNKFPFVHFYDVLHSLVRPCVKWSFSGGKKQKKILKLSAEKVVAVAYGRWSRVLFLLLKGNSKRFSVTNRS